MRRRAARARGTRVLGIALFALLLASTVSARNYPWLGVRIRDLSEQEMEEIADKHGVQEGFGVYIVDVVESAPAQKAGLKRGDIVVAVNGRPVVDTRLLQRLVGAADLERDVRLTVLRPEGRRDLLVHLTMMPASMVGERTAADFGFILRDVDGTGGATLADGTAAVAAVLRGTSADHAGLAVGDVIVEVNGRAVLGGVAAREAIGEADAARPLALRVRRGTEQIEITLTP
jgi:serine protease Do